MIYDRILSSYTDNGYPLSAGNIFVYYGAKSKGGTKSPSLNYIVSFDGSERLSGEFGKEWATEYVNDDSGTENILTANFDTIYICNNTTTNKTIVLPSSPTAGCQFAVKFVGELSCNVTIRASNNASVFKKTNGSTLASNVILDRHTPLCYLYYFNNMWIITYQGINIYNNITPYWNTKLITSKNTVTGSEVIHNTRYTYLTHNSTVTTIEFQLPKASTVHDNFRISIDTEYLDEYTSINVIPLNSQILISNGNAVDQYTLNKTHRVVLFIKLLGSSYWFAFENDEDYWVTRKITSNTTAKNRYRYVCSNTAGLSITLPKEPALYDRIAVFVQELTSPNTVKIISPYEGKSIQVGTTIIGPSDGTAANTNYLLLEANLVYVELIYYDTYWHVIKLITPSSTRVYEGGFGIKKEGTSTFSLSGSLDIVDGVTLSTTTVNQNGRNFNQFSVNNISSRLSGGFGISITPGTNGVTNIQLSGSLPDDDGKYALVYLNGSFGWIKISSC